MSLYGVKIDADGARQYNAVHFLVRTMLSGLCTATLVQVKGVTNSGGVAPVGFVDVQPLVNLLDGNGQAIPHGTIYHCPYVRMQGGSNAVILDPQVGDIGIAVFADRDISSVCANKSTSNPGSGRRFNWADAMYIGGVLNGTPNQYVEFSASGITISSPTAVTLTAPSVSINASGAVTITSGSLTHNGKNIGATHAHSGVTPGGSNTGVPV